MCDIYDTDGHDSILMLSCSMSCRWIYQANGNRGLYRQALRDFLYDPIDLEFFKTRVCAFPAWLLSMQTAWTAFEVE